MVFPIDGIFVLVMCFYSSFVLGTAANNFFLKNLKMKISASSCMPWVRHENLKLHGNEMIEIRLNG